MAASLHPLVSGALDLLAGITDPNLLETFAEIKNVFRRMLVDRIQDAQDSVEQHVHLVFPAIALLVQAVQLAKNKVPVHEFYATPTVGFLGEMRMWGRVLFDKILVGLPEESLDRSAVMRVKKAYLSLLTN